MNKLSVSFLALATLAFATLVAVPVFADGTDLGGVKEARTAPLFDDVTPMDLSHVSDRSDAVQVTKEIVIVVGTKAQAPAKEWRCTAPTGLMSDETATVRTCGFFAVGGGK